MPQKDIFRRKYTVTLRVSLGPFTCYTSIFQNFSETIFFVIGKIFKDSESTILED